MSDPTTRRDDSATAYDRPAEETAHRQHHDTTDHDATDHDHDRDDSRAVPAGDRRRHGSTDRTEEDARDRFGGINLGAAFFGWLVAIALTVLLAGIVGAAAAAVGETLSLTQSDAEQEADAVGLAAGIALVVVLMIGYYAGGYVSGRMSRYDGARQGWGVWLIGVVIAAVVALAGWIFGNEYDIFERVDMPSVPLSDDTMTVGGIILAAAILLGTLLAALAGGKLGLRYHHKVDRYTA